MNTSLKHLSQGQREKLQRVVKVIVRAILPEKIILFGVQGGLNAAAEAINILGDPGDELSGSGDSYGGSVDKSGGSGEARVCSLVLGAYDLLIVSRQGDQRSDYELQDLIESRCREDAPITALVHDIGYVNRRLMEGQHFFVSVVREGVLLYDARRTPLARAAVPDWKGVRSLAMRDFSRWSEQAGAFYRSAEFSYQQGNRRVAIFLLHQAAEQLYQAVLLTFTGYKPTTHNLDKLRRYTNRFSLEMAMVFPRDGPKEDEIFRKLLAGYVDARYKEDFQVTGEEIAVLIERIGRLLGIADRVCGNHFRCLEKRAAGV